MSAPGSPARIDSPANQRIKVFRSLASPKGRREHGRFQLEGVSLLEEALRAEVAIEAAYWCPDRVRNERERALVEALADRGPVFEVSERVLQQLSSTVTPQPIAAEARIPDSRLRDVHLPEACLIAAPVGIQDPGNLGTIIRTAHAVGATALAAVGECADVHGPKVVRATMGSLFHLTVVARAEPAEFLAWSEANGVGLVAATVHADVPLFEARFPSRTALLLGGETQGLPSELLGPTITKVAIPMPGGTESLNVAVAAGIMMYEYCRQHRL